VNYAIQKKRSPFVKNKREKFVQLAEARVARAMKSIRVVGNLSNRANYEFTENDVKKILQALNAEVDEVGRRFRSRDSKTQPTFKL